MTLKLPRTPKPTPEAELSDHLICSNCQGSLWHVLTPGERYDGYYDGCGWFNASQTFFCCEQCRLEASEQTALDAEGYGGDWPYCSECGQRVLLFPPQTGTNEKGFPIWSRDENALLEPRFLCEHVQTAQVLGANADTFDTARRHDYASE